MEKKTLTRRAAIEALKEGFAQIAQDVKLDDLILEGFKGLHQYTNDELAGEMTIADPDGRPYVITGTSPRVRS